MSDLPILGIISDLFFVARLQAAASEAGVEVDWLDQPELESAFLARLESAPPALIVLDLNTGLPWPQWLTAAKGQRVTKRIPWLAFGSHVNIRRLRAARHMGADKVVPKSQFDDELRATLKKLIVERNKKGASVE